MDIFLLFLGIIIGGSVVGYGAFSFLKPKLKQVQNRKDSVVLLEHIEKVFKIIVAEGHFSEIYDYEDGKDFWGIKTFTKKALIIVKAKVLIGFDFSKAIYEIDEKNRVFRIKHFPESEILSIDSDYKIYDLDQGIFNKFKSQDYTQLLSEAKQNLHTKAEASELPRIAHKQLYTILLQVGQLLNWEIKFQLSKAEQNQLNEPIKFHDSEEN